MSEENPEGTVGTDGFRYRCLGSWGRLPRYWSFDVVSAGTINSQGDIYVLSRGEHPVTIWDKQGNFVGSWGEGRFSIRPHGIYADYRDHIWITDGSYHIVTEHAPDGTLLRTLGTKLFPALPFYGNPFNIPTDVAVKSTGEIFVADGDGNTRMHKFGPDGDLLLSWGSRGEGPGEFALVHSVWLEEEDGEIYVCDRENNRVQVFDEEGHFLREWMQMYMPNDLFIQGDVVYACGNDGIWLIHKSGEVITHWGYDNPYPDALIAPHGIWLDDDGSIYVAESLGKKSRVTKWEVL